MKTQTIITFILSIWARFTPLIRAANEADETVGVENALIGEGVFEIQPNRWFIPYGEYPHPKGLQKFNRESGDILHQAFNGTDVKITRLFNKGVPVYKGHPDVPDRPDTDPAAPAQGWLKGITVENDGVILDVELNPDGTKIIENKGFRFFSPNWRCRKVAGGIQPVILDSIGMTNNPRIPVKPIANDDAETSENKVPKWILDALVAGGLISAEDSTDATKVSAARDKISTALGKLSTADSFESEAARLRSDCATANDTIQKLTKERDDLKIKADDVPGLQQQLQTANDALNKARGVRIGAELKRLVETGKVTAAQSAGLQTELLAIANDDEITTRLTELAETKPALKTETKTGELAKKKAEFMQAVNDANARSEQRRTLIDDELKSISNDIDEQRRYDIAFERASRKNPELFGSSKKD